ncbi:MAG: hypothetical protein KF850_20525 [Labilithrix sp.]|nr:hypothetical protein [Labilithrix sp.]
MNRHFVEIGAVAAAIASALGIALVQPKVAADVASARQQDDIFTLPPPEQIRVASFGYRHALADLIWAKMLVEHGLHWQEKRKFTALPSYLDAIVELEPDHPTFYEFVDTLIVFQPAGVTADDARLARRYLERGTVERPYDPQVWLHYGQYIAFLAPSFLADTDEIERWRTEGAFALARAVELGADADRGLAAATILNKAGEREAAIRLQQRAFALTDDPETRRQIIFKLQKLGAGMESEATVSRVEHEWRTRYPFLSRGTALLIGPHRRPDACAGPHRDERNACPRDWTDATRDVR